MGLPISKVNLVLRTASASRTGFGTPLFQTMSMGTINRVTSYTGTVGVGETYATAHPAYLAAKGYMSSPVTVDKFKIGRVLASLVLTPQSVAEGVVYAFSITDGANTGLCTYTAANGDDAEDIVDNLLADIATFTDIAANVTETKVGTTTTATISLVATGDFAITGITNLAEEYTATETYEASLAAIRAEDDDFWFLSSDTRTAATQDILASAIQATSKSYFTASSDADSIAANYTVADTDIASVLKTNNYSRAACMWDEDVTAFPECRYVGVNAAFSPDERSVVWDGRELVGMSVAINALGNELTSSQQAALDSRNCSYVATTSVGPRILGGKMGSGEWIDNIRTQDTIIARVGEALDTLILNQAGGKLVGGPVGIALVDAAMVKALNPFLASDALESFTTDMTAATIDPATRELSNAQFEVVLKGAIVRVSVNGTAVNQEV